jgi:MoaA/NifB/PqqE/SkfB family radical SAM enzyme
MTGLGFDIEITNRCNANCSFCPRDATPHQGLMSEATFDMALSRAVDYRDRCIELFEVTRVGTVDLCGLGEPLLHKHAGKFVRQVRETGMDCQMNSNGALLDERRGDAVLEAGLQKILLNVGEIDEAYEAIYELPFAKTRDNVVRFARDAEGTCEVQIVLVDHHNDPDHVQRMQSYWRDQGIDNFRVIGLMNRGGALYVDHMQYEQYPELAEATALLDERAVKPQCVAPFVFLFVGYDGQYYLCCSDWTKEAALGSVFERSFTDVLAEKVRLVTSREKVCRTCNTDPANELTDLLRAVAEGRISADRIPEKVDHLDHVWNLFVSPKLEQLSPGCTTQLIEAPAPPRRLIPVAPT